MIKKLDDKNVLFVFQKKIKIMEFKLLKSQHVWKCHNFKSPLPHVNGVY
jgi:hypothetical protein